MPRCKICDFNPTVSFSIYRTGVFEETKEERFMINEDYCNICEAESKENLFELSDEGEGTTGINDFMFHNFIDQKLTKDLKNKEKKIS